MKNIMTKIKSNLALQIFIALVLGIVLGIFLQNTPQIAETYIKPVGTLFLNLIKMVIIPLVFTSIVAGVCGMGDIHLLGKIGVKTIVFYFATTSIAVVIGLTLANVMHIGSTVIQSVSGTVDLATPPSFVDTILNIVPTNPIKALANGDMLQIIVFALFLGGGILMIGKAGKPAQALSESFASVMQAIMTVIMKFAPYGVFALITPVIAANGPSLLLPLLWLIIAVYLGCFLHAAVVYSLSLKLFTNVKPMEFFKAMTEAMMFAYTTASSSATIPFTMKATKKLGVPSHIRSFVIPLGATINMDGTAVFQGICAIFIAGTYGLQLSLAQQLTIVFTVTLASVGTAGVPGAGSVMLGMVLQSIGLPIDGIAIIMGVERILDMARTTVNITGDAACCIVVHGREKKVQEDF